MEIQPLGDRQMSAMGPKRRVLVVEDSLLLAEAICDLLHDEGLEPVGPAAKASTAFELLSRNAFDIALVNILLRNGNAVEFANHLLRRNVPFLLLTGFRRDGLPAALQRVPVVPKPFEITSLKTAMQALVVQASEGLVSKVQPSRPSGDLSPR